MSFDSFPVFDQFADKTVSATDKSKRAYVVSDAQYDVLESARVPFHNGGSAAAPHVTFNVLNSPERDTVRASFYGSLRVGSGRRPEARMGREIISEWLEPGDTLRIGKIGNEVYMLRIKK
jgi:hypothetical protein